MNTCKMKAFDGTETHVTFWDNVENPKGAVQIAHGMAEYAERYDDFAKFLNTNGYIVFADDHRGHGYTVGAGRQGIVSGNSWEQTLKDMGQLTDFIKNRYKVDVVLIGHSYGSFLSQAYIQRFGDKINGVILSGSSYMKNPLTKIGSIIASVQTAIFGEEKPAKLMNTLSFGAYDKPFISESRQFAWLSRDKEQCDKYIADAFCGYVMSLGFFKSFLCGVQKMYGANDFIRIPSSLPILVTSGSMDPVGEYGKGTTKLFDAYKNSGKNVELKLYKDARHEILNETNKLEVYKDMLSFIEKCID